MHPFDALKSDYASWIDAAAIRPDIEAELDHVCDKVLLPGLPRLKNGCDAVKVPLVWAAPSFYRESSYDFRTSPAQGDRWDRRSIHVPAGLGPYPDFTAAQVAAYKIDGLDKVARPWTLELACYYWELFNGFGYRDAHRIRSPYVVGGLTEQQKGKYVADGVWGEVLDQQLGCLAMYLRLVKDDPSLALPREGGVAAPPMVPDAAPPPSPMHQLRGAEWIQAALDEVAKRQPEFLSAVALAGGDAHLQPILRVDGLLGKNTRTVVRAFETWRHLDLDAGVPGEQVVGELDSILGSGWQPA